MENAAIDARSLPPGTSLGKFALGKRIARGGMAELYLARAHGGSGFEKLVALKLVLPQYKDDAQFLAMLRNEARLAAALEHPNIASVYDFDSDRGEHFIAMEYVHGRSVAEVLTSASGPLPLGCALALVAPACDAVQHAHDSRDARGRAQVLIHRDISPSNVLVRYDGVVKLVDFGIAKATAQTRATQTGTVKGKIGYMSPEQCLGGDLDRRTDVFALGVLLYELTVGQRLFVGGSDFSVMNRIIAGEYQRPREVVPEFPAALESIIERALASDRQERYGSASELRAALLEFGRRKDIEVGPPVLAAWIAEHFEVPPLPVVRTDLVKSNPAVGWGRRALPYVAVASVAGLVGFWYRPVTFVEDGAGAAAVKPPVVEARADDDRAAHALERASDAARPQPLPSAPAPSVDDEPIESPEPEPEASPPPEPLPERRRRAGPRKAKRAPTKRTKREPVDDETSLLPPSLRGQ